MSELLIFNSRDYQEQEFIFSLRTAVLSEKMNSVRKFYLT